MRALLRVLFGACLNVMLFWLKHFKAKKPAHPVCLRIHGSGTFKHNFQQSGGGERDDDYDCQVPRAVCDRLRRFVLLGIIRESWGMPRPKNRSVPTAVVMWPSLKQCVEMPKAMTLTAPETPLGVEDGRDVPMGMLEEQPLVVEFVDLRESFRDGSSSAARARTCSRC